jgi:hypothetical protein
MTKMNLISTQLWIASCLEMTALFEVKMYSTILQLAFVDLDLGVFFGYAVIEG